MKKPVTLIALSAALVLASSGALAQPTERQLAPYGYPATGTPDRTVVVDPGTRHVNVTRLETVAFRVGNKTATWTFDTFGTRSFPLSKVVPGADGVTVYVEESPLYRGN